jgi:hypothetical protein
MNLFQFTIIKYFKNIFKKLNIRKKHDKKIQVSKNRLQMCLNHS